MRTEHAHAADPKEVLREEPILVSDLPGAVADRPELADLRDVPVPEALRKPAAEDEIAHRDLDDTPFWRTIPAFRRMSREEFLDPRFQIRKSVTGVDDLRELVGGLVGQPFLADVARGLGQAPMNVRITPYLMSLIDWDDPYHDPLRIQFLPVASTRRPDHPRLELDSLHEQDDSPVPGLVHRYPDKVLFLPLDVCPVYCRYCTRSYAIGGDTATVDKESYRPQAERWRKAMAYNATRPQVEDVVVSGGDAYMLPARRLLEIGEMLLAMPHVRRIRIATKGPAVMPMKILRDTAWTNAVVTLSEKGRRQGKEVCLHTHFNHPNEITAISAEALGELFSRGVTVRNQSVLIRGVNDDAETMTRLVRRLSYVNVQPYYVYQHDMVKGVEDLRTTLAATEEVERSVRGSTAGFNTPTFVTDVPGGGGKRDLHSYDHYDRTTGISVYRSPVVDPDLYYLYFDPLYLLPEEGRRRWCDESEHQAMIDEAVAAAGLQDLQPAVEKAPARGR